MTVDCRFAFEVTSQENGKDLAVLCLGPRDGRAVRSVYLEQVSMRDDGDGKRPKRLERLKRQHGDGLVIVVGYVNFYGLNDTGSTGINLQSMNGVRNCQNLLRR